MKKNKALSGVYVALMLMFLYLPIMVLIVFSFNETKGYIWSGFSLKWYFDLFSNERILASLKNTLIIAAVSSVISTLLGASAAVGVYSMQNKRVKGAIKSVTNLPLLSPEIVMGISLMLLFSMARMSGGFLTLIIAHVSFCVPSVFLSVLPKLRQLNPNMYEAALDLGCNPFQAFVKVLLPEIMPGVITGFLMALTYSLDDFVVSYFTAGNVQTLSIEIYSMVKKRVSPEINALSTIMFVVVLLVLLVTNIRAIRKERAAEKKKMQL
ncbi:MAG: ABC transporter permease [Clostridia bacterium]|nr:ABC transporter permease [Clostridia bacterium]